MTTQLPDGVSLKEAVETLARMREQGLVVMTGDESFAGYAALDTVLSAIPTPDNPTLRSAPGFVVVPREPTEEMLIAPDDAGVGLYSREIFRKIWEAMLSAAPGFGEEGEKVGAHTITSRDERLAILSVIQDAISNSAVHRDQAVLVAAVKVKRLIDAAVSSVVYPPPEGGEQARLREALEAIRDFQPSVSMSAAVSLTERALYAMKRIQFADNAEKVSRAALQEGEQGAHQAGGSDGKR